MEVYGLDKWSLIAPLCCWPTTPSNILIVDHNSVKVGLKVSVCIVLSAEYWCPNGTCCNWCCTLIYIAVIKLHRVMLIYKAMKIMLYTCSVTRHWKTVGWSFFLCLRPAGFWKHYVFRCVFLGDFVFQVYKFQISFFFSLSIVKVFFCDYLHSTNLCV